MTRLRSEVWRLILVNGDLGTTSAAPWHCLSVQMTSTSMHLHCHKDGALVEDTD